MNRPTFLKFHRPRTREAYFRKVFAVDGDALPMKTKKAEFIFTGKFGFWAQTLTAAVAAILSLFVYDASAR